MGESSIATLADIRKIAVFRPSAVGDFVFALPALHALRQAYPHAHLCYVGKAWHADFLHQRPGPIDEVKSFPPCPGIAAPDDTDMAPVRAFSRAMRAEKFDLAIQMYGGGRYANPLVRGFGARVTLGFRAPGAPAPDRWLSYATLQNRRLQLLELVRLAGARRLIPERELDVCERDRREAAEVLARLPGGPLVVINPAASDPRRHWPAERFAAVADRLADAGASVAINATAAEARVAQAVLDAMRHPATDLSGLLSLSGLCGLLERASLLVSNDSGPLHLALAIGTPAVGIYWRTNLYESMPLTQDRHRAALSTRLHCPVCGAENLNSRCPHDVCFVDDVPLEEVMALALELFHDPRPRAGRTLE